MVDDAVEWVVHPLPGEGQDYGGHGDGNEHRGAEEKAARKFFVEDNLMPVAIAIKNIPATPITVQ